jgi:hypothetical protein
MRGPFVFRNKLCLLQFATTSTTGCGCRVLVRHLALINPGPPIAHRSLSRRVSVVYQIFAQAEAEISVANPKVTNLGRPR